jgi:DNA-binding CsgD family transcriptional regulator
VTTPTWVSDNDIRAIMRIANAPDPGEDGVALPWSTLEALAQLIPATTVAFNGMDVGQQHHYLRQRIDGDQREEDGQPAKRTLEDVFWHHYPDSHCSHPERTGDYRSAIMPTDFCSMPEHRQTPMYVDYMKPAGIDHAIMVTIPDGGSRQLRLRICRGRSDPDFTERDRALLTLLRPHLREAHLDVLRRRNRIPALTTRQWELLHLIEAGLGNKQIARRLNVTENTVRKHIENIFLRLDVTSRTAALARAFPTRAAPQVAPPTSMTAQTAAADRPPAGYARPPSARHRQAHAPTNAPPHSPDWIPPR